VGRTWRSDELVVRAPDASDPTAVTSGGRSEQVELGHREATLLAEAMALTDAEDAVEVIRIALAELVERRRFQRWVEARDPATRSGRA
jgi:hypothetical protein